MLLLLCFALAPFAWPPAASSAQIEIIPGSSAEGVALFSKKGCIECHAFNGAGGLIAPDLAQMYDRVRTPYELASDLWNHAPRMWSAQAGRLLRPTLDSMETADLFAYFYALSYTRAPGDAKRGAAIFQEKQCAGCHEGSVALFSNRRLESPGPPVSTWTQVNDPMGWAEQMWNHSGSVFNKLAQTGIAWPTLTSQDMADLLAYLRSAPEGRSPSARFQPGNPEQGRVTFERSCESCHSFGATTGGRKIDLLKRAGPDVLIGYVAAMWNHAPIMHARAGANFPVFGPGDMNNLAAYLFAQRYFDEQGDPETGASLFKAKNCASCHELRRKQTGAPDLTASAERYSPITMAAAIWRHGPVMLDALRHNDMKWPELNGSEMSDIAAYLNSRLVPRVASPNAERKHAQ